MSRYGVSWHLTIGLGGVQGEVTPSSTTRAEIGKDKLGMGFSRMLSKLSSLGALLRGANLVFNAKPWGFHTPNCSLLTHPHSAHETRFGD